MVMVVVVVVAVVVVFLRRLTNSLQIYNLN